MLHFVIVCALLLVGSDGLAVKKSPRTSNDMDRVINGSPAFVGEFPSQLSLRTYNIHSCGAAIINSRWALTAAHCLTGSTIIGTTFLSGTLDRKSPNGTVHPISEFIVHPDYVVFHEEENDIAVVKVTVPFDLDGILRAPIALPDQDQATADFSLGTISGWGETVDMGALSDVLLKVDVIISNQTACRSVLQGLHHQLYPTHICADAPPERLGPCYGDYGGPLYVGNKVAAIASWGDSCKLISNPYTVYTQVSPFVDWIYNTTGGPPAMKSKGLTLQLSWLTPLYLMLILHLYSQSAI